MGVIKIGIIGVGNCASALIQGINYYKENGRFVKSGLINNCIGSYLPGDIEVRLAYDIDKRKVGKKLDKAIFELPNCTKIFCTDIKSTDVKVKMGKVLDGCAEHMALYPEKDSFRISDEAEPSKEDVVKDMQEYQIDLIVNYLPVGSDNATKFYIECALEAGVGVVNCIPVFIASDKSWEDKFIEKKLPIIGDDIKSQFGATILHRIIVETMVKRGIKIDKSYQLNTGGNTDFLNMLERKRLNSKKISKTEAVQTVAHIEDYHENLHVGPSDYVPWQNDNKVCFIRIEGKQFGDIPMNLELRLSVEDSPNSAGVVVDAIRCCKLALDRGLYGSIKYPSAYFCKHPKEQVVDSEAYIKLLEYIDEGTN